MESKKSKKAVSFENALKKLEDIVASLESGQMPLEKLVESYKEGLYYQQICQSHLNRAELLVETLEENGRPLMSDTQQNNSEQP